MKKITVLLTALLIGIIGFAQEDFSITSNFGDIEDGKVFEFNTTEKEDSSMNYVITNESDNDIHMRLMVVSMSNTDGTEFEACLGGQCYYQIVGGETYPFPGDPTGYETIEAGESNSGGTGDAANHIWNKKEEGESPEEPIVVDFEFQRVDETGSIVLDKVAFTYIYEPELSVDKHENFGVQILNTVVKNGELNIKTQEPAQIEIYNLLGQKFNTLKLESGINKVDVSNLSTQIYLVRIQNERGAIKTQKIVVE